MSDFFDDVFMAYCGPRECKECPLSRETSKDCRDLFARKMKAWAGKQDEMTAAKTTHPTAEDINVPAKLPAWVKVGQWVTRNDCFTVEQVTDIKEGEIAVGYAYDDEAEFYRMFKPVRFREYTYEKAKGLIGKTMEYEATTSPARNETVLIHRVTQYECDEEVYICAFPFSAWKEMNATIDGVPIGVPEVDEDAMKEVEE